MLIWIAIACGAALAMVGLLVLRRTLGDGPDTSPLLPTPF